jgi:hypothetical protein
MSREPLFGRLDRDLACAIGLGIVAYQHVTITPEAITMHDENMRDLGQVTGWLAGDDPLDRATYEYLSARRDAMLANARQTKGGWGMSAAVRDREKANQRANQAKAKGRALLEERGVLAMARKVGMTVLE